MEIIVAITVGLLVAIGIWMLLDRGLLRVVLGIVVLGNGVNLAVFSAGRLDGRAAAFVTEAGAPALAANPLPQALVLTAIVISFAMTAVLLVVAIRGRADAGTDQCTLAALGGVVATQQAGDGADGDGMRQEIEGRRLPPAEGFGNHGEAFLQAMGAEGSQYHSYSGERSSSA